MSDLKSVIEKYNVPAPRYTSYPTVPFWDTASWSEKGWLDAVRRMHLQDSGKGVGIYVHLPFCESLCTYCGCNTRITKNHAVEDPYVTSVLREWDLYKSAFGSAHIPVTDLHLGGGTPTFFTHDNLHRLITGLLGSNTPEPGTSFSFEAHPANTTKEHLQTLFDLGFRRLSLGIQDFDPKVQFIINRKQTEEDVLRVMDQARSIGYTSINFDLIYGLPLQTRETVEKTIRSSLAMRPDRISFYSYAHVPWMKPAQRRFTEADLPVGEAKLQLYLLGKELIQEAGYQDVGMDHFSLEEDDLYQAAINHSLHRNFMGYTDRHIPLLIGLGVSSISDAWYAFGQNVKTVEEYHKLIGENKLPLVKGHLLTKEDLNIRRQILDIMCKGETHLDLGDPLTPVIMEGLEPLMEDNLVEIRHLPEERMHRVKVTELGKSFLRNICMAFDLRLIRSKGDKPLFSHAV